MFDILSDGDFDVSAQAEGYASEKKRGVASGGDDLAFALVPEAIYSGKVVAGDGNDPVAKAKVTLASVRGDSFSADSDDQGNFVIRKITPGTFVATVNHREYATRSEPPREIAQAEKVEGIVLRLPAGFVATGAVVDSETQEPVAEAQVFFDLKSQGKNAVQGPGVRRTGKTGTDGRFEVKGLGEGTYSLSARAKGFLSGSGRQVEISAESEREFSVPIDLGGSISGRVIESTGTPVAGATVRPSVNVTSPEEWNQGFGNVFAISVATLADGSFKLEGLLPHKAYTVSATQKDHAPGASKGIVVERRGSVEGIEITLPPGATIRGRITDASGSTGIAGASVQAQLERQEESENRFFVQNNQGPSAAASDSEGNYILKALAAGSYTVRVQAKDRMSASRTGVEVEEGGTASGIDLVLGAGETLRGKVVDSDGAPVAGADVQISSNESAQTRTDAEGKFQATGVPKGSVSVNVSKQGFEQSSAQVKAPGPEVQVTLQRSAKIRGNIHAPDQETYKNYQVAAVQKRGSEENDWGNWRYSQRNDATGAFEVSVGEGTWIIQATMQNFAPGETEPITVKAGDVVDSVVVEMKKGGEIAGTVTDRATGDPIEGAQVSFVNQAPETQRAWRVFGNPGARTDAEGAFTLEGVLDGTYTIVASHANYAQGGASGIVVTSGRSSPVKVELGAGGGIRGTVIKNGSPVPNLEIVAFLESPNDGTGVQKQAKTDAEGRFEILGLAPGEYNVMIGGWGRRGALNAQKKATVYEGQVTELEVDQGATLRLYGRVTSGGAPAGPGRIDVFNMTQGPRGGSGDIDASGSYSVELPSAGAYLIFISLPARGRNAQVRFNVTIPAGVTAYQHDIDIPSGEVFGVVFDAATGEGVPGVEVLAFAESVTFRSVSGLFQGVQGTGRTDDSGRFAISGLAPGTYTLKAFVTGYADGVAPSVRVGPQGVGMEAKIALERGISFSARVLDAGGRPVAGATVILRDEAGSFVALTRPVTSDKDGNLAFSGIRPAAYQATVVHEQYAPSRTLVEADEGVQATLRVDAGTSLSIRVTDRRGRPLEGATVELVDESGLNVMDDIAFVGLRRGQSGVSTRSDGTLTLDHLAPGRYVISARTATAASREERITLQEGKAAEVKLSLSE
jgi:uncharacterized GH25 family protein